MNIITSVRIFEWTLAFALTLVIMVGCASYQASTPDEPAPSTDRADRSDGQIEEVVVTGTRSDGVSSDVSVLNRNRPRVSAPRAAPAQVREGFFSLSGLMADHDALGRDDAAASSGEEIWIIAKSYADDPDLQDESPGTGAMLASVIVPDDDQSPIKDVPMPLQHTAVKARIEGYISTVEVTQQFTNPFDTKIEATYLFPLPEKAAVNEFLMIIGERRIRGILREKKEAEAIYEAARNQGYQASLLVQHRPNVFEQKVANIEPGDAIDVNVKYFHTLAYNDGWYSFVFPTVVGPRYNPAGTKNPIEAVVRGDSATTTGNGTAAEYLKPSERTAHDLSIEIDLDAGVTVEELRASHQVVADRATPQTASVRLAAGATMPNRDFILDFRVAGERMKSNLMTYEDPDTGQGYFTMMLYPPQDAENLQRTPMEMVFVLDASGSMRGTPLAQAKQAVATALDRLTPQDTFQIIRFSDNSSQFGTAPVPATRANLALARRYLGSLSGSGGTQMIEGVKAALSFPHDPARLRFVSFMTDGYIGNEYDIIEAVHDHIGNARIFSFGVGSSVNRFLLERMAKVGRGAVAYLGPQDAADDIMGQFFTRISHPALRDVQIDWGNAAVSDVYPAKMPDIFVGRPLVVTGKYAGQLGDVTIAGISGQRSVELNVGSPGSADATPHLSKIWARLRIADLADRQMWSRDPHDEIGDAILQTALEYQLMSDYTSFVAVDSSNPTAGDFGVTVPQAIPVPQGVRYDTTVNRN